MEENILLNKTKTFSLDCIAFYKKLQGENEFVISKQLLRSATSIGANIREAMAWQSKKDFFAKICIAYKEAHECAYWLELLNESDITGLDITLLQAECVEIIKMLAKTKLTTEKNLNYEPYEK